MLESIEKAVPTQIEVGSVAEPSAAPSSDPLLECLAMVSELHGLSFNREVALSGLPLQDGHLTPTLLLRAAHCAGFHARLVERPIRRLPRSVLPAILLLSGNRAGVLVAGETSGAVELHVPGDGSPDLR